MSKQIASLLKLVAGVLGFVAAIIGIADYLEKHSVFPYFRAGGTINQLVAYVGSDTLVLVIIVSGYLCTFNPVGPSFKPRLRLLGTGLVLSMVVPALLWVKQTWFLHLDVGGLVPLASFILGMIIGFINKVVVAIVTGGDESRVDILPGGGIVIERVGE